MDIEIIKAIGEYIIMPLCVFGFLGFLAYMAMRS